MYYTGVSPDRVKIISVTPFTGKTGKTGVRSTRQSAHPKVQIHFRVLGTLRLTGVDRSIRKYGIPMTALRTQISRDHHVDARPWPIKL